MASLTRERPEVERITAVTREHLDTNHDRRPTVFTREWTISMPSPPRGKERADPESGAWSSPKN